ncbi:BTB/POZ domain-containing protein KCTD9 [Rhipicephalus sanguineus]|uniref:BTB/POZ domain-containing protein KCTD9 n=1 Tax=Rhipicephalus sanguineus TaxID=34632 RepID=UPI0020C462C9|nr:BTB/POZ domain-containing protein KCTD9 [Rhipicephalus sanguineus]
MQMQGCDLSGVDLSRLDLHLLDFRGANLSMCNLERADLSNSDFEGAQLYGAKMMYANLEGADCRSCKMGDPDGPLAWNAELLTDAIMDGSVLYGVNFRYAKLYQRQPAELRPPARCSLATQT